MPDDPPPPSSAFSDASRLLVCTVGSHHDGDMDAQIAISIYNASLTPERPRLLVLLWKTNHTRDLVEASRSLCIAPLARDQLALIEPLGVRTDDDAPPLAGLPARFTPAGDPYFDGSTGYIDAAVIDALDLGDATAFLVGVRGEQRLRDEEPLTWQQALDELDRDFLARYEQQYKRDQQYSLQRMRWL